MTDTLAEWDRVRVKSRCDDDEATHDPPVGTELTIIEDRHNSDPDLVTVDWPNVFDDGRRCWRMPRAVLERIDPALRKQSMSECWTPTDALDVSSELRKLASLRRLYRIVTDERLEAITRAENAESELAAVKAERDTARSELASANEIIKTLTNPS
jgi:hypothetical protein